MSTSSSVPCPESKRVENNQYTPKLPTGAIGKNDTTTTGCRKDSETSSQQRSVTPSTISTAGSESKHTYKNFESFLLPSRSPPRPRTPPAGLSMDTLPKRIKEVQYAVRGAVLDRALEMEKDLSPYPFDVLVPCHIGNPHAVGMPATSYIRETMSLVVHPGLPMAKSVVLGTPSNPCHPGTPSVVDYSPEAAEDILDRAQRYRSYLGDAGNYTHSRGSPGLREEIADWFEERDGERADPDNIFLTNGAGDAVESLLTCLIDGPEDAVMIPLPQYPLYSATITKLNGTTVYYELDEENDWGLDMAQLVNSYDSAVAEGKRVRALCVICPGNPAPTLYTYEEKTAIFAFCAERGLVLIADEVYQQNLYLEDEEELSDYGASFRKVMLEQDYRDVALASLHSSSKGLVGECGFRGGLMLLENVEQAVQAQMYKLRSISLCSNTMGQVVMTLVVRPPKEGDASYALYAQERDSVISSLRTRARVVYDFLNSLEGVTCSPIRGALYAFPRIHFPEDTVEYATKVRGHKSVNLFYSLELLEATGIITTPGDGFGEKKDTYHIRITILPEMDILIPALESFRKFHESFWNKYCRGHIQDDKQDDDDEKL